jgi:hypothetical protein
MLLDIDKVARFEVFVVAKIEFMVFWVIVLCSVAPPPS